jgi:hypothetical protein
MAAELPAAINPRNHRLATSDAAEISALVAP